MKDELIAQLKSKMQEIMETLHKLDVTSGPVPDSIFQGVRSEIRALEEEVEYLYSELQNN